MWRCLLSWFCGLVSVPSIPSFTSQTTRFYIDLFDTVDKVCLSPGQKVHDSRWQSNTHSRSTTIIHYHQLSFTLNTFKFFMIFDDTVHRLTTCMRVDDSVTASCFSHNRRAHSYMQRSKWPSKKTTQQTEQAATLFRLGKSIFCDSLDSATPGTGSSRDTLLRDSAVINHHENFFKSFGHANDSWRQ